MKKMIRLKGLCLKVSETLNTKKIEKKKKKQDAHICISSKPVPRPQSCQAQLAGRSKKYLII